MPKSPLKPNLARALAGSALAAAFAIGAWSCDGATPPRADPVVIAAGDIARCSMDADEITAALVDRIEGTVMALGDNAYEVDAGSVETAYTDCYASSWGRHKARTRPTPGNHEYLAPDAAPYFAYFGEAAGPPGRGYYSYHVGQWHLISLNSNVEAGKDSEQLNWLRADLAANARACTVAYWHHPVFSSGMNGNGPHLREIWKVLDDAGVDLVVVAHDHDYERFAPQNDKGQPDPNGIRQIVVGTGGGDLRPFATVRANSEVRESGTYGVLKLTLRATSYDWEFVPQPGSTFTDVGSAVCVN
jgi:hypothetical protein